MANHTLYAYAEGSDLHDVADSLDVAFAQFAASDGWICGQPWTVNQRRDDDPSLGPDDLPDWEIGVNLPLPDAGAEPPGWFNDIDRLVAFLERLQAETGRDFVIGIADSQGISEDLVFIHGEPVDRVWLRRAFGVD